MDAEIIAAIVTSLVSLAVAGIAYGQTRQNVRETLQNSKEIEDFRASLARRERQESDAQKRAELVSRFREPLARAAYDLQSRLWNILCHGFLDEFLLRGSKREESYAVENTVFLASQYFAWTEIIRREIQFIDLEKEERTRDLAHLQDFITKIWGTDRFPFEPCFRVWAGEQRAIGEALIQEGPRGPECMGYGAFLALPTSAAAPLLDALREDVRMVPRLPRAGLERIIQIQHALIDLLGFLDPDGLRFPTSSRTKATCLDGGASSEKAASSPTPG